MERTKAWDVTGSALCYSRQFKMEEQRLRHARVCLPPSPSPHLPGSEGVGEVVAGSYWCLGHTDCTIHPRLIDRVDPVPVNGDSFGDEHVPDVDNDGVVFVHFYLRPGVHSVDEDGSLPVLIWDQKRRHAFGRTFQVCGWPLCVGKVRVRE